MSRGKAEELLGIEIDDREVRLAVAAPAESGYALRAHCRPLPAGAVEEDTVVDRDAAADAIRQVLSDSGARVRRATLVLGGPRVVCRVEPVRERDDPSVATDCEDRMRRYVVFGGQPTVVAHTLEDGGPAEEETSRLLSAAALRGLVASQVGVAKRAGVTVVRAEPRMSLLARVLLRGGEAGQPRFLLVADHDGCEVGLLRGDGLIFCTGLATTAQALCSDGQELVASLEQLEDYHLRHARGQEAVEELVWCGSCGEPQELFERLAEVGVRPRRVDPASFAGVGSFQAEVEEGREAEPCALAPVAAAALADAGLPGPIGPVDLLPAPRKPRRRCALPPWAMVPAIVTFLAMGTLVGWDWAVRRKVQRLTHRLNHPTERMLECSRLQRRHDELKRRSANARRLFRRLGGVPGGPFLEAVSRRLPQELWLDRVRLGRDTPCVIAGMAAAEDKVFAFADVLRDIPCVEAVHIGATGSGREAGLILTEFRLDVTLARRPGGGQEASP
ncbi:MAG: hypothetical protein ACLF0G_11565 [Candidatus Brocadiia bacterium]